MNFENLVQATQDFITAHPYITGAILAVVGVLSYFKLKLILKAVTACLILGIIVYVVLFLVNLASTGVENTEEFLGHPNKAIDRFQR
jgi:amino acid transporter